MKNKFNETGTDFGKALVMTKIDLNRFSIEPFLPKEVARSISRANPILAKKLILELLETVNTQDEYDQLCSELDKIMPANEIQNAHDGIYHQLQVCVPQERPATFYVLFSKQLKGGAPRIMAKTITTIKGVPVIDIYESFDGSYWFITEKLFIQDSVINGMIYEKDQILFGYARLSAWPEFAEFGHISETELKLVGAWKVPKKNWSVCPEVEEVEATEQSAAGEVTTSLTVTSCLDQCKEVI